MGPWISGGNVLQSIGFGSVGMADLRGCCCAVGPDQPDQGAKAPGREEERRHGWHLDTGRFGPRQRDQLPSAVCSFNDQIDAAVTVEAANKAKNLSDQGVVHCRDTNPLAGAGTRLSILMVDVTRCIPRDG